MALSRRHYIAVTVAISLISYLVLLHLAFNLDLGELVRILTHLDPLYLTLALLLRLASFVLHSTAWYLLLRIDRRDIAFARVVATVLVAVVVEFLVPVGGAAEVVKILLITQLYSVPSHIALASLLMHRQVLIAVTLVTSAVAICYKEVSPSASLMILLPTVGLLTANTVLLLTPTRRRFRVLVNRLMISRLPRPPNLLNASTSSFFEGYREAFRTVSDLRRAELLLVILVTVLEKLSNSAYGIYIAALATLSIDIPTSLIAFDSIYAVLWLLPIITPGNLGIFETIQTVLLKVLGVTPKLAAIAALVNRVVMVLTTCPLIPLLAAYLGVSIKQLVNSVSRLGKRGASVG